MAAIDNSPGKPKTSAKKGPKAKSFSRTSRSIRHSDLLSLTINVKTGQVVKIESVDSSGARRELSDEEKANLTKEKVAPNLEAIVEQAFEAGIDCVLGNGAGEEDQPESKEDANLRHLLLRPLIEDSAAKRLIRRDVLSRTILKTMVQQAIGSRPEPRE